MSKFKKGDRVVVVGPCREPAYSIGDTGTVDENNHCPKVKFDNGKRHCVTDRRMELIPMNRLAGLKLKFDVTDNPELSEAIQKRVFELGGHWHDNGKRLEYLTCSVISLENGTLMFGTILEHDAWVNHTLSTLDDLYHLPKTHTITIDGKDVELSHESFENLREQLV